MRGLSFVFAVGLISFGCLSPAGDWQGDFGDCAEIGCDDRLEVAFDRLDGKTFDPGSYRFVFALESGDTRTLQCNLGSMSDLNCKGTSANIEISIEDSGREFVALLSFAPPSLNVEVFLEDQLLASENLTPDYTLFNPNGPECETTCLQASVVVSVNGAD